MKEQILSRLNIKAYYEKEVSSLKINGSKAMALCPFHDDHNPSLSIDLQTGRWHCFACDKGGSLIDFHMRKYGLTFKEALEDLAKETGIKKKSKALTIEEVKQPIIEGDVRYQFERLHEYRAGQPPYIKALYKSPEGKKTARFYTVSNGESLTAGRKSKPVLYGLENPLADTVLLTESEKDADRLLELGFSAVATGGATTFPDLKPLERKTVVLIPHLDEAGQKWCEKILTMLSGVASSVKVIDLKMYKSDPPEGYDIADLIKETPKDEVKPLIIKMIEDTNYINTQSNSSKTIVLTKFYPRPFTEQILKEHKFLYEGCKGSLWWFDKDTGIWKPNGEDFVRLYFRRLVESLDDTLKKKRVIEEIISDIQDYTLNLNGMPEPDVDLIPCRNGVYNIKTDTLEQFKPEHYFTWRLPWKYNPYARCDFLKKLIDTMLPENQIVTLYELMAYCLYRGYPYQKFFILLGRGRNGKGVFTNILIKLLGSENVSNITLNDIQNNRFAASSLYHKLANISGEVHYSDLHNTQLLKQLTGGDLLECDRKYKKAIKFINYAKLIFSTNQLPKTRDKTDAFYRRAFIVNFPYQFRDNPSIDIKLRENSTEMQTEYEGLLFEVIKHLKRLRANDFIFTHHQSIEKTRAVYESLSNPLLKFIEEHCEKTYDSDDFIYKFEFSEKFKDWCQEQGFNRPTNKKIGRELKELGFEDGQRGERRYWSWLGLKWKNNKKLNELTEFTEITGSSKQFLSNIENCCNLSVNSVISVTETNNLDLFGVKDSGLAVKTPSDLEDDSERVIFEERAAIMEYDGKVEREKAEIEAIKQIMLDRVIPGKCDKCIKVQGCMLTKDQRPMCKGPFN